MVLGKLIGCESNKSTYCAHYRMPIIHLVRGCGDDSKRKEPIYGTITGYDDKTNMLVMSQIQATQDIKVGDKVGTSGLGGISPNSLYIGTVEEVAMDRFGLYKEVKIRPAADTNDVRYVTDLLFGTRKGGAIMRISKRVYWVLFVLYSCFFSGWSIDESFFKIIPLSSGYSLTPRMIIIAVGMLNLSD